MKTKIIPDYQKAQSLQNMASITLERLKTTDTEKYPSNTLTDYYDVIHKLMEAISYQNGIKFKGEGAHQELVTYACDEINVSQQRKEFLQQMREYRNRIAYEGFMVQSSYIHTNKQMIEDTIRELKNHVTSKMVKSENGKNPDSQERPL